MNLETALCRVCGGMRVEYRGDIYPNLVCWHCDHYAINARGEPARQHESFSGDNPVYINDWGSTPDPVSARKCWRIYGFHQYETVMDEHDCSTLREFFEKHFSDPLRWSVPDPGDFAEPQDLRCARQAARTDDRLREREVYRNLRRDQLHLYCERIKAERARAEGDKTPDSLIESLVRSTADLDRPTYCTVRSDNGIVARASYLGPPGNRRRATEHDWLNARGRGRWKLHLQPSERGKKWAVKNRMWCMDPDKPFYRSYWEIRLRRADVGRVTRLLESYFRHMGAHSVMLDRMALLEDRADNLRRYAEAALGVKVTLYAYPHVMNVIHNLCDGEPFDHEAKASVPIIFREPDTTVLGCFLSHIPRPWPLFVGAEDGTVLESTARPTGRMS